MYKDVIAMGSFALIFLTLTAFSTSLNVFMPEIKIPNQFKVRKDNGFNMTIIEEPHGVRVNVSCSSNEPASWRFHNPNKALGNILTRSLRARSKSNGISQEIFINWISIVSSEEATGSYECFNTQTPTVYSFIYLVFTGVTDTTRTGSILHPTNSEEISIAVKYSANDKNIILPWPSANPEVSARLTDDDDETSLKILEYKKDYDYDPRFGFILNLSRASRDDFSGTYVGHLNGQAEVKFVVTYSPLVKVEPEEKFLVLDPSDKIGFQFLCSSTERIFYHTDEFSSDSPKIECNSTESFDKRTIYTCTLSSTVLEDDDGQVACFGSPWTLLHPWRFVKKGTLKLDMSQNIAQCRGGTPTKLVSLECANPTECALRRGCLNGGCQSESTKTMKSRPVSISKKTVHISSLFYPASGSGIFKCSSDYGEVEQMYFRGQRQYPRAYYTDWTDAKKKDDLILITSVIVNGLPYRNKVYEGELISVEYSLNRFVFSEVTLPTLFMKLENGTEIEFPSKMVNVTFGNYLELKMSVKVYKRDMKEIIITGPVWNSTDWLNKSIPVNVLESKPVRILNPKEHYTFYSEEPIYPLHCNTSGLPKPKITWFDPSGNPIVKNAGLGPNSTDHDDHVIRQSINNRLNFPKHDKAYDGVYTCMAENVVNQVNKSFIVTFSSEPRYIETTSSSPVLNIVVPIIIALLLITVAFLLFRMWRRKRIFRELNEYEYNMFKHGRAIETNLANAALHEIAENLPFKPEFEIPRNMIVYDENSTSVLGRGAYGCVYKGNYARISTVAIKTVTPNTDVVFFKALLSELKLISYIGDHPNVFDSLGLVRSLSVIYCENGSLLNYLEKNQKNFRDLIRNDQIMRMTQSSERHDYMNQSTELTTMELVRFSIQIISGLQYLRERGVIHGDLAARNILLDGNLVAKLADFGLSRQLVNCANYVKRTREPLPWRYMAIESLQRLTFSYDSDIWGLGVTIWEIFSLGNVPYPGYSYTNDFIQLILNGMRLSRPIFATSAIYHNVILPCWKKNPEDRIRLDVAKQILSSIYRANMNSDYDDLPRTPSNINIPVLITPSTELDTKV